MNLGQLIIVFNAIPTILIKVIHLEIILTSYSSYTIFSSENIFFSVLDMIIQLKNYKFNVNNIKFFLLL